MSFEFTLLDALQDLRCPVLDALAVFFDQAGAHGEIWIAFTAVLLAFRRTRRAGLAMALALGLYMLAGHCALKPLFARPRPCDLRPEMLTLVARPHGWSFPSGHILRLCRCLRTLAAEPQARHPGSCAGRVHRLHADVPVCAFPHRHSGRRGTGPCIGGLRLSAGR